MKLTEPQKKVLAQLKAGAILKRDRTFRGGYYIYENEESYGKKININTAIALYHAGLIRVVKPGFPFDTYGLVPCLSQENSSEGK